MPKLIRPLYGLPASRPVADSIGQSSTLFDSLEANRLKPIKRSPRLSKNSEGSEARNFILQSSTRMHQHKLSGIYADDLLRNSITHGRERFQVEVRQYTFQIRLCPRYYRILLRIVSSMLENLPASREKVTSFMLSRHVPRGHHW